MLKRVIFVLLVFWCSTIHNAQSQELPNDVLYVDLNSDFSIINNSFTNTWDPSPAGHLNIRVPYHATQLEAGIRYTRFSGNADSEEDSDFHSLFIHFGINYPIKLAPGYHIAPALRFGNHFMLFDEPVVFTNNSGTERFTTDQTESEFSYEFALQNQIKLNDRWSVNATVSYNRTLTFFPLSVTLFSVGISRSFAQPPWFKKFMQ